MEGFEAWDRHDPLPHIAPLTVALKSAYKYGVSVYSYVAELRELLILGGRE
jgi:hypothetical protein